MSPPSASIRSGAGFDQVGEVLRTSYQEEEPENLDGRLTALMLQLSIDPPEGQAPVTTSHHAWAILPAMARIARACWTALVRMAGFSFRRR